MLSAQQIQQNIKAMEQQGASQREIDSYLSNLKPDGKSHSFLQSMTQAVAEPFLRTGLTVARGISDDTSEKDFGFFGSVAPYRDPVSAIGGGLEIGGTFIGGGGAAKTALTGLRGAISTGARTGLKAGATSGSLIGTGMGLQEEDRTLGSVLGQTAIGTGIGGVGGGVLGGAFGAVGQGFRGLTQAPQNIKQGSTELGQSLLQRIQDASQPIVDKTGLIAKRSGELLGEVPARMASRAKEGVVGLAERQKLMESSAPHIREALKQGIDDPTIKFLQSANTFDKKQRVEMLNLAKQGTEDLNFVGRPVQKVGENIINGPVDFLIKVKNKGIQETRQVLKDIGSNKVNIKPVYNQFIKDMGDLGLTFKNGTPVLSRGSRIPQEDLGAYQLIHNRLASRGKNVLTTQELHNLRQVLFDTFDIARQRQQPFTDTSARYAQNVRFLLGEMIDKQSKGSYGAAQKKIADTSTSLEQMAKFLGHRGKIEDITTKDLKAGESFMRVFGNASDRPMTELTSILRKAGEYGYKEKSNILSQLRFADMLDNVYGMPSRSLGGQVGRATQQSQDPQQIIAGSIREAVKWSPYSAAVRLLRNTGIIGRRPEDVVDAFERLILQEAGVPAKAIPDFTKSLRETGGVIKDTFKSTLDKFKQKK